VAGTHDDDDGSDLAFGDVIGKTVVDLSARHQVTASWLAGAFTNDERDGSGAKSSNRLGSVAWRAVMNGRLFTRVQGVFLSKLLVTPFQRLQPGQALIDRDLRHIDFR
jgi:hypothetical protein